jgi:integrase
VKTEREKYLDPPECLKLIAWVAREGTTRDHMLLLLGMNLAARVSELVRLRVQDFFLDASFVRMPTVKRLAPSERKRKQELLREGKQWRKTRLSTGQLPELYLEIPLAPEIGCMVNEYIRAENIVEWLFPGRRGQHLSRRQAERVFTYWASKAGIRKKGVNEVSIHSLRHARGVDLYEKGLDLLEIREYLRHESLSSAGLYQHLSPRRRAEMVRKVGSLGIERPPGMATSN